MASGLHGNARTTPPIRGELQPPEDNRRALAASFGLNPRTVATWRGRAETADAPIGSKAARSTALTPDEGAIVVEFRRRTLAPLDDVLGCLRDTIPHLSRSALYRFLQRHSIYRRPTVKTAQTRKHFKTYEIGYVRIDSCELPHAGGKLIMFLAIDCVSTPTYAEFHASARKMEKSGFLKILTLAFPYESTRF